MANPNHIQVASISHQHGVSCFAGATLDDLYLELAEYCQDDPELAGDQAAFYEALAQGDTKGIIDAYFEDNVCEWLDIQENVLLRGAVSIIRDHDDS